MLLQYGLRQEALSSHSWAFGPPTNYEKTGGAGVSPATQSAQARRLCHQFFTIFQGSGYGYPAPAGPGGRGDPGSAGAPGAGGAPAWELPGFHFSEILALALGQEYEGWCSRHRVGPDPQPMLQKLGLAD
jgi:hypothetical protein